MSSQQKAYYAARSMVIYRWSFHRRYKKDELFDIDDINGEHLCDLFMDFCSKRSQSLMALSNPSKYIAIGNTQKVTEGVLVAVESGLAGEERLVYNVSSAKSTKRIGVDEAAMVPLRLMLSWKGTGRKYALLCVEHAAGAAGDTALVDPFKRYLRDIDSGATLNTEPQIDLEALDSFQSLEGITVRKYRQASDIADQLSREGDVIEYHIGHKRGAPFQNGLAFVKDLTNAAQGKRATMLGLKGTPLDSDESKTYVTLRSADGSTKKFELGGDYGMKIRELLNEAGQRPLSQDEFVERCNSRCASVVRNSGRVL
jgi:hypothetical protein